MTTKRTGGKIAKNDKKEGFEKSLERLETIVNEMEAGSLSLEEMIERFEEGQALVKFCSKKLNEVERKIEVLVRKGDDIVTEPFDENILDNNGDNDSALGGKEELF